MLSVLDCIKYHYINNPCNSDNIFTYPDEQFKWVPGYEKLYQASTYGRIWSCISNKFLKTPPDNDGRPVVNLWKNKKVKHYKVCRLIAITFLGPVPNGQEVCHENGDCSNNKSDNLRYDIHSSNCEDKEKHGTWQGGENHGGSYLTEENIRQIKRLKLEGLNNSEIARKFNMSREHVRNIVNGIIWSHVE